jgi:hypothetical protein
MWNQNDVWTLNSKIEYQIQYSFVFVGHLKNLVTHTDRSGKLCYIQISQIWYSDNIFVAEKALDGKIQWN